ncbi:ABC transporter permease [Castellaniella sp.]|uniref:ABC transporter permease n=1 Tax=Castellaniella sp. TaxID=1955812 RepID=UPI0035641227
MVAAGLSLIFGVTRIVNFAHGSLYMLGLYVAYTLVGAMGHSGLGFWASLLLAGAVIGVLGALIEVLLLRRIYRSPELFQLLATFALVLIFNDMALWLWGAEDLLGPRAPGLEGAIKVFEYYVPTYDIFLVFLGPLVLVLLWLLLTRTRWGTFVRAATQDREMLGALGVNQALLFTSVFALGAFLAGLGGAFQIPRTPANLGVDIPVVVDAFVIVVVGGMGSIPGAYVAALIIAELKAICVALGTVNVFGVDFAFPRLTLVVEFIFMALVLIVRPWGLLGRSQTGAVRSEPIGSPLRPASFGLRLWLGLLVVFIWLVPLALPHHPVLALMLLDIAIAALFALSLHFMMGPGGMPSFGHAAFYGLGAYAAALLLKLAGVPMVWSILLAPLVAGLGALVVGWFCVRLSGVYLAMLTLAAAQIIWSIVYQWDDLTGGSNGILGLWPPQWLDGVAYYYLATGLVIVAAVFMRRILFSPFGWAMRACRDSAVRAEALGIDVKRIQWAAFVLSGMFAGLAGALFAFSKGSIDPDAASIGKSVDALVIVLLGGIQTLSGPLVGAGVFHVLEDYFMGATRYWHAWFGGVILLLVLVAPSGVVGLMQNLRHRWRS